MNLNTSCGPFGSISGQGQGPPVMPSPNGGLNQNGGNGGGGQPPPQPTPPEGAQQFCLRWNSYPATVATQLAALRANDDFVDVTLACDAQQLKAHKLVLSACSPYFMQLFKSNPCQHPIVFLRDVAYRQLEALIEFMYAGEVNVSQAELPGLLRTAELLQVRGLADTTPNNNNNNSCPLSQQQPKTQFSPQYGHGGPVMNTPQAQGSISSSQAPLSQGVSETPLIPSYPQSTSTQQQQLPLPNSSPVVTTASSTTPAASHSHLKTERNMENEQHHQPTKRFNESESNAFDIINSMDHHAKGQNYNADRNMTDQLEDTGQIFPDDSMGFDLGDGEVENDNGENMSEESSEDASDDDDGECKEYSYQSDSQEGMVEGDGNINDENAAGPSVRPPGENASGSGGSKGSEGEIVPGLTGSGRNRLSRSLWPPGIPYHGPQQCPYCTRTLSNVGNWRKHVLTMHFAREKVYKCEHCTSSFRTAEYLQKHYVRVHNYPQKMTRRKYVEQT